MDDYSDIIMLPHPEPRGRRRMSMQARAAQFAPFAALTGHSDAIAETARYTEEEIILEKDNLAQLDFKIKQLLSKLDQKPQIRIAFFKPDANKSGGSYQQFSGNVQMIDSTTHSIVMTDGLTIGIHHIFDIQFL